MKLYSFLIYLLLAHFTVQAQYSWNQNAIKPYLPAIEYTAYSNPLSPVPAKLMQRNHGVIVGIQRGGVTALELGGEAHWRKISLKKPTIYGATANMEYNFGHHILGYKAGMWMKRGRINFTYGANLAYFTDFEGNSRYGINPAVGFRLLGFHLINGYNLLAGDKELDKVNTMYLSLRYYFPLENKFTWDRKNKDKDKARRQKAKAKEKKKKQKEKEKRKNERRPLFKL